MTPEGCASAPPGIWFIGMPPRPVIWVGRIIGPMPGPCGPFGAPCAPCAPAPAAPGGIAELWPWLDAGAYGASGAPICESDGDGAANWFGGGCVLGGGCRPAARDGIGASCGLASGGGVAVGGVP